MAILLAKVNTNAVPDSPGRWKAGEVVSAFDDGHEFGTKEVPEAGNFYHITITDKEITVEHKPLHAFKAGVKQLDTQDIEQLYWKETRNGASLNYTLNVKLKGGDDKVFISWYIFDNEEIAQEIERRIENF